MTDAEFPAKHATTSSSAIQSTVNQRRSLTVAHLDNIKRGRERVVILGSGWAGYTMARDLDHRKFQAVIVSPRSYFVFTPLLASTAVGTLEFRTAIEPLRSRRNRAEFIQAWADDVDFFDKKITVEEAVTDPNQSYALTTPRGEGKSEQELFAESVKKTRRGEMFDISYDKLVIAVGCYSQTFNTAGVRENALFLKDVGDARRIRKRLLECFELAALPTTPDRIRKQLLNFAIVGGGPTGIEFCAELHDLIHEDLRKIYPDLVQFVQLTVHDVSDKVLGMFDRKLSDYAMKTFRREGIQIKTSSHIESLSKGFPGVDAEMQDKRPGLTLQVKGEPPTGIGMCVWSTGLMQNPFVDKALSQVRRFPSHAVIFKSSVEKAERSQWAICKDEKSGSIITNDRLRVITEAQGSDETSRRAFMRDVFAVGDCAILEGSAYPATAQVANQKASWLAKRLNKNDLHNARFSYKNLGVMAYIGNWNAILQGPGQGMSNISGRAAWVIWRGAYLVKSISWRNKILIPVYW